MKQVGFIALIVASLILQLSFLPALRPFGIVPSLMLVVVALVGLEGTASVALIVGVASGIAMDLASGANFGMWTGVLAVCALVTGVLHRMGIETKGLLPGVAIVISGTVLTAAIILMGLIGTTQHWPIGFLIGQIITEIVVNLVLLILLRPLVRMVTESAAVREPMIW
jgi:rod shape-determining protein MreD